MRHFYRKEKLDKGSGIMWVYFFVSLIPLLYIAKHASGQDISINEIMSSNSATIADEDGDYPDWIELYNYGTEPVDLEGFGLSDDINRPFRWVFPKVIINPDKYLLIWASNKDRVLPTTQAATLIAEKSEWTYLDDGSDQGTLWREPGFNDSLWSSGPGMLGYGGTTFYGTILDYGPDPNNKHITYYFRKNINIPDVNQFDTLDLRLMIDDGAVVYINGTEVVRRNMPAGEINYLTTAVDLVIELDISLHQIPASLFQDGDNTIAVEVHQFNSTSSDIRFDMELWSTGNALHTNFAISSEGEEILLTRPDSVRVDEIAPIHIPTDISYGRYPNGTGSFLFYYEPTPGTPNHENGATEILSPPVFSHEGGFYTNDFNLSLSGTEPGIEIYYTLDGSEPDPENLDGKTYQYKNQYPFGPFLEQTFQTQTYTGQFAIYDRSDEPNKISEMASTYQSTQHDYPQGPIFKGTPVRARAFSSNAIPSEISSHTFIVTNEGRSRYSLPVISINIQEDGLYDYETGIYVPGKIFEDVGGTQEGGTMGNYWQRGREWERSASLEFFEPDAVHPAFKQDIGVRLHGGWSRGFATRKSLRIYARASYGESHFNHQVFPDLPYSSYKRLILRSSGNDWDRMVFRDAAIQEVLKDLRFDTQGYRPSIVLINGEYWGIHNIRERYDRHYLNRVYGVDPDNLDLLTIRPGETTSVKLGDMEHFNAMTNYLETNNMALDQHYNYIQTQMDVDNFIDYQIANIYAANRDWPGNNIDYWRLRTPGYDPNAPLGHDGRWRWMLFDTDFGFGGSTNPDHNTLRYALSLPPDLWQNPQHSTVVLRRLLLNEEFQNAFINRFADLMNTVFLPANIHPIVNEMRQVLEPEMEEHIYRWGPPWSLNNWNNQINGMTNFTNDRPNIQRNHIRDYFALPGTVSLWVNVSNPQHGHVKVNTLDIKIGTPGIPDNPHPWIGSYFRNIPIEFEAIPTAGYAFRRWEGLDEESHAFTTQVFSDNSASVTAFFEKADLLHYWHFNTLSGGNITVVPADHSLIGNAFITYPGTGEGYMDRVNEGSLVNAMPGISEGYALRVRNPSDTRELMLEMPTTGYMGISLSFATHRTANGAQAQTLYYRTSPQGNWVKYDNPVTITENFNTHNYYFSNADVNNNPDFTVKIVFGGSNISGTSGNNRFDNIRVDGISYFPTNVPIARDDELDGYPDPKIYYSQGTLFVYNPYPGTSTITIFDIQGVAVKSFQLHGQGMFEYGFNPRTGIYIGRLVHEKKIFTTKFLVN